MRRRNDDKAEALVIIGVLCLWLIGVLVSLGVGIALIYLILKLAAGL